VGRRHKSEPTLRKCIKCGSTKHVRTKRYVALCRKCFHTPLEEILTKDELEGIRLLRSVLGERK